jgi:hypothetical protein
MASAPKPREMLAPSSQRDRPGGLPSNGPHRGLSR